MEKLIEFALLKQEKRPRRPPATFGLWKRCYRLVGNDQGVEDVELEVRVPNTRNVLDGGIDIFIQESLRQGLMEEPFWCDEDISTE